MKIGVLGYGSIGQRHVDNLRQLGIEPEVYDPLYQSDRADVIANCNAIIIASPTHQHRFDLYDCIRWTKAHILIEKPLVKSPTPPLRSLLRAAQKDGRVVMMGNNLRFHHCVLKAKEWLDDGLIGQPQWAQFVVAQYSQKTAYLDDGVTLNWLSHELDLALHLLGPAKLASSTLQIINHHDRMADIVIEHKSGCRSILHADYITKPEQRWFSIVGSEGRIIGNLVERMLVRHTGDDAVGQMFAAKDNYDENYLDEMRAFLDAVQGRPLRGASGWDGLACLRILWAARKIGGMK